MMGPMSAAQPRSVQHPSPPVTPSWVPGVLIGLLGSLVLGVAMFTPGFLPTTSPVFGLLPIPLQTGQTAVVVGVLLSVLGWLLLRPVMCSTRPINSWSVLGLWALPLLFVPPVMSNDPYLYADQAWTVQQGANPYLVGLSALPGPYSDQVDGVWQGSTAVYPALHLITTWLAAGVTGFHPYWGVVAMRLPAVLGVVLLGLCLPRLARAAGVAVGPARWFCLLNPIVVVHQLGGAHNDALMVGLVAAALWWAVAGRWPLLGAPVLLGLAVAVKQPAALAGLGIALLIVQRLHHSSVDPDWRGWSAVVADARRCLLPVAVTAAVSILTLVAVSYALGFGLGWLYSLSTPGSVPSPAPVSVLTQLGVPGAVALWLGRFVLAALVIGLLIRHGSRDPWRVLVGTMLALALTGAVLHGWYLAWGVCFFALARFGPMAERALVTVMILMLVYLSMAEYIGIIPLLAQALIGFAVAIVLVQAAYVWPAFAGRMPISPPRADPA